jgi:hypothetical protein
MELMGQVWQLIILVIHLLIPQTISLSLMMFFTFQKHIKTLFLSIVNSVFLEIHIGFFLFRDQASRRVLLRGCCYYGLYPIPCKSEIKQVLGVFRPSFDQWHSRFGHPSSIVVANIISSFNLPVLDTSNKHSVCNACQ